MTRNFGSPRCIGAETTPGAPSPRVAVSREPVEPFDVMQTIDVDYAESFERDRCQLCGEMNGHRFSCVVIQKDYIDAKTLEPIRLAGGPPTRSSRTPLANSRGASPELSIREYATAFFVSAFLAGIAVCLWFLCLIIDWSGVVEALRQG